MSDDHKKRRVMSMGLDPRSALLRPAIFRRLVNLPEGLPGIVRHVLCVASFHAPVTRVDNNYAPI